MFVLVHLRDPSWPPIGPFHSSDAAWQFLRDREMLMDWTFKEIVLPRHVKPENVR